MAADQRNKRVNAASFVGCTSNEPYRVKRKKTELLHHGLETRPSISLQWDNKKKSVVSKREQIGISRRDLIPFIEPGHHSHDLLADVISVPREIFELEDLSEVLSYEVWQTHLSETERSFLSQLLPVEAEPDAVVHELLAGDNMHFGNPFLKWSASLCLGDLHPDSVLHEEQSLKAGKKAYYSDLQKYHNNMIENLQLLKEKWTSCQDPEGNIVQNIWRSRKHAAKDIPPSEIRFYATEENLIATPESCSWPNSEKACSSDNQNMGNLRGESQRRKGFSNKKSDVSSTGLQRVGGSKKGENVQECNIQQEDGAKYMSYIKVSKKQHERVKSSMKHASHSIQPRSLNNVLGSIDALNVQPFERFEEEEKKKLHEYWLKVATKDIFQGFDNWKRRQLKRQQLGRSLGAEIEQKLDQEEILQDEEKEGSADKLIEVSDDSEQDILPSITIEGGVEKDKSDALLQEQMANEEAVHEMQRDKEDEKEIKSAYIFEEQTHDDTETSEDDDVPDNVYIQGNNQLQIASLNNSPPSNMITPPSPGFLQGQRQHQLSSININSHVTTMEMESHHNSSSVKAYQSLPVVSNYLGNLNNVHIPVCEENQLRTASDVWAADDAHGSFYQSSATNAGYASNQQLPIRHQQFIQEQPVRMRDLELETQDEDAGKVCAINARYASNQQLSSGHQQFIQEQPVRMIDLEIETHGKNAGKVGGTNAGYASNQRLPTGRQQYIQEQPVGMLDLEIDTQDKDAGKVMANRQSEDLPFFSPYANQDRNELLQSLFKGQNNLPYHQHQHKESGLAFQPENNVMMDPGQFSGRLREPIQSLLPLDLRQKRLNDMNIQESMYSGGRYGIPITNWAVNSVRMPVVPQPILNNSGTLSQNNWDTGETRDGWSSFGNHTSSLGSVNNSDQTLFSVLSECNGLRPGTGYDSVGSSTEQRFIQAGNYSGIGGGGLPSSSNFMQQSPNPLHYLSGHEPVCSTGMKMNNLGWVGLPQQNSGLQDPIGKPLRRSWNQ